MKTAIKKMTLKLVFSISFLVFFTLSCDKEDEGFPITNDLRVIQIKAGTTAVQSGVEDLSVQSSFQFVFSHPLNVADFESAFSISPTVTYALAYDDTESFVTLTFDNPLSYETSYTISLPKGKYGAAGKASKEDFEFTFTTEAFSPPKVTLSSSSVNFYEGEDVTVTAKLDNKIFSNVTMDVQFAGTATGGGTDYTVSQTSITIPAESTSASIVLSGVSGDEVEGTETIIITITNLVNAIQDPVQSLTLNLGDAPPSLELKGIMSLKIGGTGTNGRAIHLRVLEDIADLSEYGIGIANNGGGTDGREIDFPAVSATAGEDILLVRDIDDAGLATYFESCYTEFEHVIQSGGVNFNGDDAVELFQGNVVIETYGDVTFSTVGDWEYTGTWAYKFGTEWVHGPVDCSVNSTTSATSNCQYPFCAPPVQLQGILAISSTASNLGTNGGKAVHVRVNKDIADFSQYGMGITNNGGGVSLKEFDFPAIPVKEGEHILFARDPTLIAEYLGSCYNKFAHVFQDDNMTQNGDDAVQLFAGNTVIETYGDIAVDGTGQPWDYTGSWAFKVGSVWVYGGPACAEGATSNSTSGCPYQFCTE